MRGRIPASFQPPSWPRSWTVSADTRSRDPSKKLSNIPTSPHADLVKVEKDCAAISGSANWEGASRTFLDQAGSTRFQIDNRPRVRLAFLDTQPTGMGVSTAPGNSHHGYTLTHIARNLVCGGSAPSNLCAAQITTRLALPITHFNAKKQKLTRTDLVRGGYIGMQGDLANAIRSKVDAWWSENKQARLVLNLSVAWDGRVLR